MKIRLKFKKINKIHKLPLHRKLEANNNHKMIQKVNNIYKIKLQQIKIVN